MKRKLLIAALCGGALLHAQKPSPEAPKPAAVPPGVSTNTPNLGLEDPTVLRARFTLEKVKAMVDAGTLPRARLERAQEELLDAQDEAYITRALYGQDLTAQQADDTVEAAKRRLDRRKKSHEEQQKLVEAGVISIAEMKASADDVDRSSKEYDWAVARANLVKQIENMAASEAALLKQMEEMPLSVSRSIMERFDGKGAFSTTDLTRIQAAFSVRFSKPLPISAMGQTAVHRSLGFDHTGRVDVALNPDQPEGAWLRTFLTKNRIPFFAFRGAVAHKATGAHIHIGPGSSRIIASSSNGG